jgi:hypothetical protein
MQEGITFEGVVRCGLDTLIDPSRYLNLKERAMIEGEIATLRIGYLSEMKFGEMALDERFSQLLLDTSPHPLVRELFSCLITRALKQEEMRDVSESLRLLFRAAGLPFEEMAFSGGPTNELVPEAKEIIKDVFDSSSFLISSLIREWDGLAEHLNREVIDQSRGLSRERLEMGAASLLLAKPERLKALFRLTGSEPSNDYLKEMNELARIAISVYGKSENIPWPSARNTGRALGAAWGSGQNIDMLIVTKVCCALVINAWPEVYSIYIAQKPVESRRRFVHQSVVRELLAEKTLLLNNPRWA